MRTLIWIRDLIFQNILWKLLSLAIAVVIWALVATEPELATFASVRLEYKNLPQGLEISSDPVSSVLLELRGPAGALRSGTITAGTWLGGGFRPAHAPPLLDLAPNLRIRPG